MINDSLFPHVCIHQNTFKSTLHLSIYLYLHIYLAMPITFASIFRFLVCSRPKQPMRDQSSSHGRRACSGFQKNHHKRYIHYWQSIIMQKQSLVTIAQISPFSFCLPCFLPLPLSVFSFPFVFLALSLPILLLLEVLHS